jgi:hypothetical protein
LPRAARASIMVGRPPGEQRSQADSALDVELGITGGSRTHPRAALRAQAGSDGSHFRAERIAVLPALYPEWLGDRSFTEAHGLRFPYVAGAMANGIATPELVVALARSGMLGFFGAAGLAFEGVEAGLAGPGEPADFAEREALDALRWRWFWHGLSPVLGQGESLTGYGGEVVPVFTTFPAESR